MSIVALRSGPTPALKRWRGAESGTASAELVILVVPIMVLVAFVVFAGRYSATDQEVTSAARDAARAASVEGGPASAAAAGRAAATASLADRRVSCASLTTSIDTSALRPGGQVTAQVSCVIDLDDIAGFAMPGTKTVTASATVVVDTYRGGGS